VGAGLGTVDVPREKNFGEWMIGIYRTMAPSWVKDGGGSLFDDGEFIIMFFFSVPHISSLSPQSSPLD
jgi:hypothetical protein